MPRKTQLSDVQIQEIVSKYVSGISARQLGKFYKISHNTISGIITSNNIILRDRSQALRLRPNKPFSDEHKKNISIARTEYLRQNPDKVPYRLYHSSKHTSYPVTKFITMLKNIGIVGWVLEYQMGIYSYDIAFPELKLDVEIDGGTHLLDNVKKIDNKRDGYSRSIGWIVLRFSARDILNDMRGCVDELIKSIYDIDSTFQIYDSDRWNAIKDTWINKISILSKTCTRCGVLFNLKDKRQQFCGRKCASIYNRLNDVRTIKNRPSLQQLVDALSRVRTYTGVGKLYSVSDNTIRKWLRGYGLDPKAFKKQVSVGNNIS